MKHRKFKKIIGLLLGMVMLLMPYFNTTILAAESIIIDDISLEWQEDLKKDTSLEYLTPSDFREADGIIPNPDYLPNKEFLKDSLSNDAMLPISTNSNGRLADGVYVIINAQNGKSMASNNAGATSGTAIVQNQYTNSNDRAQLFKVTYLGTSDGHNYYSIRPMTNNSLGVSAPNNSSSDLVSAKTMSTTEILNNIYQYQRWIIAQEGNYYTIQNTYIDENLYLSSPDNSINNAQLIMENSLWLRGMWTFEAYTGASIDGVVMTHFTSGVAKGSYFSYSASAYSSTIGRNGPVTFSVADISGNSTNIATVGSTTGYFRGIENGQVRLYATYPNAPWLYYWIIDIQFENQNVFLQNVHSMLNLQSDTTDNIVKQSSHSAGINQMWFLEYYPSEGAYKIKNINNNLYLTAPSSALEGQSITVQSYSTSILERQLWTFEKTVDGTYKIKAKSHIGTSLAMTATSNEIGSYISQNEYNGAYLHEWRVFDDEKILNTPLIMQQTSKWCWVTCAQMMVRTFYPTAANYGDADTILAEQRKAVYDVFGDATATYETYDWNNDPQGLNLKTGYYTDVESAAQYFNDLAGGNMEFNSKLYSYEEAYIQAFIYDGYPIVRLSGGFNVAGENVDIYGHATIIVGYRWDETLGCYIYIVNNPARSNPQELTYDELQSYESDSGKPYYWVPSVVVDTFYG